MERSNYDKSLEDHYFGSDNFKTKKKTLKIARQSGAKKLPDVITKDGKIMVRTGISNTAGVPVSVSVRPAGAATVGAALQSAKKNKKKGLFKKILKGAAAVGTGGASLALSKKGRAQIKKGAKKVGKVAKKLVTAASLAPLIPLRGVMSKALVKSGFVAPKKLEDLANAFYSHIVKRSPSNYESRFNEQDNLLPLAALVPPIIGFVKDLINGRKKKKAGVPVSMTPVEEAIAADSEKVVSQIEAKAAQAGISTGAEMPGSNSKDNPTPEKGGAPDEDQKPERKALASMGDMTKNPALLLGAGALALLFLFKN